MATVWVIEQGSYSDYSVVGVFTSKENAERVVARIMEGDPYEKPTIVEWPLDPAVTEINAGKRQWNVHMLKNGDTESVKPWRTSSYDLAGEVHVWERTKAPAYKDKGVPDVLQGVVWATDEAHALKVMNEHRLALIAAGKF